MMNSDTTNSQSIEGASLSSRGSLLQRFRDLHEYLCLLGDHINQINNSLDRIEKNLKDMQNEYKSTFETNKTELEQIKDLMVAKSEVESLMQELNDIVKVKFPSLLAMIPEKLVEKDIAT